MATKNLTSAVGHLLPVDCVIPVDGASRALHRKEWIVSQQVPTVVQATTRVFTLPITWPGRLSVRDVWLMFSTVPAVSGGTATIQIDSIAVDGTTAVVVVTAVTILSGFTNGIPVNLTLAATNPTSLAQGTSLKVSIITSNNSVGTADVGFGLSVVYTALDPDPIIGTA